MSAIREISHLPIDAAANTKHTMNGAPMKPARHLVLEIHPEGTYIFRYAADWSFSGDTWHMDKDEALGQIEFEYEVPQLEWRPITEEDLRTLTNKG